VNLIKNYWVKIQAYWHQLPIVQRGSIAICIPLACLVASVAAHNIFYQRTVAAQRYVVRTNEVLGNSQRISIDLLNAESSASGYYIGEQKVFLKPYRLAVTNLEPTLTSLERLVGDRPEQAQRLKILAQIARHRLNVLQQNIATAAFDSPQVNINSFLEGKRDIGRFQEAIAQFEAEERRILAKHNRSLQDEQQIAASVMWAGSEVGIVGTLIAVRILRQLAAELRARQLCLKESRNTIEAIVDNIIDGVATVDARGKIETFNQAAVNMFGYVAADIIGCDWQKLLTAEAEVNQHLLLHPAETLQQVLPASQLQQAMGQRQNGDWFPIEFSINRMELVDDERGAIRSERIIIIRDITERQQSAAKLHASATQLSDLNDDLHFTNRSLLQTNSELDQFAYITAHDLKAPLRAIASLSEWIEEDLDDNIPTETRAQMHLLRGRVYRMQALLNSLLEYSRSGRAQTPTSLVDVNCLVADIISQLAPPATFTIDIVAPLPTFNTRKQPLKQVLSHLIDNAIRHHPSQMGKVKIWAIDLGEDYEFTIADDGDGIEPEYQNRIYTIFQTLKARDLQENIGAGLAIVKKIIVAEGGTIYLESAAGEGAAFKFTWRKQPITYKN
jgi:PAS domain S-box-containing protein